MKKRRLSNQGTSLLFLLLWHTLRLLPLPVASRLLSGIMRIFAEQLTNQQVIRDNLAKAFPGQPSRWVRTTARKVAANLGLMAAELCHIDHFRAAISKGKLTHAGAGALALAKQGPVIFVGTHQNNWEIVPLIYADNGIRVTIIYANLGNAVIDDILLAQRRKTGAEYVERPRALRALVNALASGGSLALLMDQRVKSGVEVEFLGRRSLISSVPARLAIRFRCPVVPTYIERRHGHRLHAVFCDPIFPPAAREGAEAEQLMTQAIAGELEKFIRKSPDSWFCSKRRWPDAETQSFARST